MNKLLFSQLVLAMVSGVPLDEAQSPVSQQYVVNGVSAGLLQPTSPIDAAPGTAATIAAALPTEDAAKETSEEGWPAAAATKGPALNIMNHGTEGDLHGPVLRNNLLYFGIGRHGFGLGATCDGCLGGGDGCPGCGGGCPGCGDGCLSDGCSGDGCCGDKLGCGGCGGRGGNGCGGCLGCPGCASGDNCCDNDYDDCDDWEEPYREREPCREHEPCREREPYREHEPCADGRKRRYGRDRPEYERPDYDRRPYLRVTPSFVEKDVTTTHTETGTATHFSVATNVTTRTTTETLLNTHTEIYHPVKTFTWVVHESAYEYPASTINAEHVRRPTARVGC